MRSEILYESGEHKWIVLGRDNEKKDEVIDTNEFIIINNGQAILLDPGGIEIFPQVLTELTRFVSTDNIKTIIASHQDPDIASSLAMWLDLVPDVKIYCSWIWTGFIAHFGMGTQLKLNGVQDEGMEIQIGNTNAMVYLVPAHYCHSSGNFSCYDPKADILFSGDIGGSLNPGKEYPFFVDTFEQHIQYMEKFHKRWMPTTSALKAWVRRARLINPSMICPQHGSLFTGDNVGKLLNWLDGLDVGHTELNNENIDINKAIWMKWKK